MNDNPDEHQDHDTEVSRVDQSPLDYDVGYKKPPKATQFQKGQSGNPQGRPKGTKNFHTDLQEELFERIRVSEGGKPVVMSKQRAIIKRTVELSLKGNMAATNLLTKLIAMYLVVEKQDENSTSLSGEDRKILERFLGAREAGKQERSTYPGGRHDAG